MLPIAAGVIVLELELKVAAAAVATVCCCCCASGAGTEMRLLLLLRQSIRYVYVTDCCGSNCVAAVAVGAAADVAVAVKR